MTASPPINVLFICTGNSCRSQMAEAILRKIGGDRFIAHSAGSQPAGFIHQLALDALEKIGISANDQRSKSWNEFAKTDLDVVISLCDSAAKEPCPIFPGKAIRAHWSTLDPVNHFGTDKERLAFAVLIAQRLQRKVEELVKINFADSAERIKSRLDFLGEI